MTIKINVDVFVFLLLHIYRSTYVATTIEIMTTIEIIISKVVENDFKLNFTSQPLLIEIIISKGLRIHFKLNNTLNEIVVRGNMYTKMNFLCTKLRKMSTKGKKSKGLFQKWCSLFRYLLQQQQLAFRK